jgi:hypothetical protein
VNGLFDNLKTSGEDDINWLGSNSLSDFDCPLPDPLPELDAYFSMTVSQNQPDPQHSQQHTEDFEFIEHRDVVGTGGGNPEVSNGDAGTICNSSEHNTFNSTGGYLRLIHHIQVPDEYLSKSDEALATYVRDSVFGILPRGNDDFQPGKAVTVANPSADGSFPLINTNVAMTPSCTNRPPRQTIPIRNTAAARRNVRYCEGTAGHITAASHATTAEVPAIFNPPWSASNPLSIHHALTYLDIHH